MGWEKEWKRQRIGGLSSDGGLHTRDDAGLVVIVGDGVIA